MTRDLNGLKEGHNGNLLPLQALGEILSQFPEAKEAVGRFLEEKLAEAKRERLEAK